MFGQSRRQSASFPVASSYLDDKRLAERAFLVDPKRFRRRAIPAERRLPRAVRPRAGRGEISTGRVRFASIRHSRKHPGPRDLPQPRHDRVGLSALRRRLGGFFVELTAGRNKQEAPRMPKYGTRRAGQSCRLIGRLLGTTATVGLLLERAHINDGCCSIARIGYAGVIHPTRTAVQIRW